MVRIFRFLFIYTIIMSSLQSFVAAKVSLPELQKVALLLCQKFHIKNKLDIKYGSSYSYHMMYQSNVCYVNKKYSDKITDSAIYFCLLHEFRHYIQDINGMLKRRTGLEKLDTFYDRQLIVQANKNKSTIWFPDDVVDMNCNQYHPLNLDDLKYYQEIMFKLQRYSFEKSFKPYEYDAEMFAVKNISCPVCYDVILSYIEPVDMGMEGYWGFDAMMQHRESKQNNQCCKAHSFSENKQSNEAINQLRNVLYTPSNIDSEEYKKMICYFDNKCGTLSDHHTK